MSFLFPNKAYLSPFLVLFLMPIFAFFQGWVVVENATVLEITSKDQLHAIAREGMERRVTAGTNLNSESSRSHLILSVIIEATNYQTQNLLKGKVLKCPDSFFL